MRLTSPGRRTAGPQHRNRGLRQVALGVVAVMACWLVAAAAPALADSMGSQFRITDQGHDGDSTYYAMFEDIAYGAQAHQHLVVFISSDADAFTIKGQFLNGDGTPAGSAFVVAGPDADYDWEPPAVAYDATNDRFLVVWTDNVSIFARTVAPDGSLGTANEISGSTYTRIDNLDVAWASGGGKYLVAWSAGSDGNIHGRLVDPDGAPLGSEEIAISHLASGAVANSSISIAYNTVREEFLVAWQQTASYHAIWGQRVALGGSVLSSSDIHISPAANAGYVRPRVAFDAGRDQYLVVFAGDDGLVATDSEMWGQFVDGDGSLIGTSPLQISDGRSVSEYWGVNGPDLVYDAGSDRYLVVFQASLWGMGSWEDANVYGDYISGAGALIGNRDFQISSMGSSFAGMRPTLALDTFTGDFMALWHGDTDAGDLVDDQWQVYGRRVSGTPSADTVAPWTTVTPSQAASGTDPADAEWWKAAVGVSVSATDAYNGGTGTVTQTRCLVKAASDTPPASFDDLPDAACSVPDFTTEGRYVVYAASIDEAGNKETPVARQIFLDMTDPSFAPAVYPSSTLVLNQTGAYALAHMTDTLSGVASSYCDPIVTSSLGARYSWCQGGDEAGNYLSGMAANYFVGYKVNVVSPSEAAEYKAGKAVAINVTLTDVDGVRATDLSTLAATCPVSVAATGDQTLASTCMKYSKRANQFNYTWRLGRSATGSSTITVTVKYPSTTATTTKSVSITIVPTR